MSAAARGAESPRKSSKTIPRLMRWGWDSKGTSGAAPLLDVLSFRLFRMRPIFSIFETSLQIILRSNMYSVSEEGGQYVSKLFNFSEPALGKLDKVCRVQEQPSDEALQARVRRVPANDVKDRILREGSARTHLRYGRNPSRISACPSSRRTTSTRSSGETFPSKGKLSAACDRATAR